MVLVVLIPATEEALLMLTAVIEDKLSVSPAFPLLTKDDLFSSILCLCCGFWVISASDAVT